MGTLDPGQEPSPLPRAGGGDATRAEDARDDAGPGSVVVSCSALAGDPVVNRDDVRLGTLARIMIDVRSGRIARAVFAHGGVLGIGERHCGVEWSALTLDSARRCFVLDMEPAQLEGAPRAELQ